MHNRKLLALISTVAVILAGTSIAIFANSKNSSCIATNVPVNSPSQNLAVPDDYKYPVNGNGQTYGPQKFYANEEAVKEPDLMAAEGIDGTSGYVKSSELDGPNFHTPEEAIKWQNRHPDTRLIPLYDKDGKTVIGSFRLEN